MISQEVRVATGSIVRHCRSGKNAPFHLGRVVNRWHEDGEEGCVVHAMHVARIPLFGVISFRIFVVAEEDLEVLVGPRKVA